MTGLHRPVHPVRFVTAASLFDGHDAAINIMRRLLQSQGAEVIHLGHNRSVDEVVRAAVAEDVQGVAISSYQGGHMEYFQYLVDRLRAEGRGDVRVYGGGGGVIVPTEIEELEAYGVERIFSPADGQHLGLEHMINVLIEECDRDLAVGPLPSLDALSAGDHRALARWITHIEAGTVDDATTSALRSRADRRPSPVLGITGTGGSGKSSLTDELIRRFRIDQEDKLSIAVLAVDPTRRRGGGALLGDRIRMNAIDAPNIYFRSLATRGSDSELPTHVPSAIAACAAAGFDLVIVETPGIGQGDAAVAEIADVSLYVMTPEFGAASQLEKIDMLELADVVAINKFDRQGADDAIPPGVPAVEPRSWWSVGRPRVGARLRHHRLPVQRRRRHCALPPSEVRAPVSRPASNGRRARHRREPHVDPGRGIVPAARRRYLAEIADTIRAYHRDTARLADEARRSQQVRAVVELGNARRIDTGSLAELAAAVDAERDPEVVRLLEQWEDLRSDLEFHQAQRTTESEDAADSHEPARWRTSLSGTRVPRVALPRVTEHGELIRWLRAENLPGHFPFTAGVFPFKREGEDPARMFAGEGDAFRTNRRFHLLAEGQPATRLSTAFDSVTLYGFDPDERPDIYGKIGTSGVSIATLDDMKALFDGFDLCDPTTSVSMTINGPAPTILAMFLNTAIDQQPRPLRRR